ncbi:MAG: anti-sigma factor [Candidatus Didemnitutus sp.]|nr:anti-sigma factor [Candidatus Didemnitutus sp.]
MSTERHEELAALYALGLLEGEEKRSFEADLAGNPALRTIVDELSDSSAALALAVPQVAPPRELRDRILSAAATPAASPSTATVVAFPLARVLPWAAAACLAVSTVFFAARTLSLRSENDALRTERQLAEVAYQMAQSKLSERSLLAERMIADLGAKLKHTEDLSRLKITALASLAGNSAEAKAIAVWDPEQQSGLLTVEKLPAVAAEQDYQIWVIDPQYPIPVDGGVFKPDADGKAVLTFKGDKPVKQASAFAISLEKKGGVPKAEGPLVLLGKF